MSLFDSLKNEIQNIEDNFEPFRSRRRNDGFKDPNQFLSTNCNNFDIISQLVGAVPTQRPKVPLNSTIISQSKPDSQEKPKNHYQRMLEQRNNPNTSCDNSFTDDREQRKRNMSLLDANVANENISNISKNSSTNSIYDSGIACSDNSRKRNIEDVTNSPAPAKEHEFKKPKVSSQTIRNLNKFAFSPQDKDEDEAVKDSQTNVSILNSSTTNSQKKSTDILSQTHVLNFNNDDLDFDL